MDVVWLANGVSSLVINSRRAKGAWFGLISEQRVARPQTPFSSVVDLPPGLPNLGEKVDAKKMHRDQWAKIMYHMSVNRER